MEERQVRALSEPPYGLHQRVDLRLVDRRHARIARVQDDATDGPEDGLTGVRTVAEPHGLLDEGVDVAAERETHALIELPDAVPGHGQQPLPIEPGVAVQAEVVQVRARLVAKRLARGADPIAPLTTDPPE